MKTKSVLLYLTLTLAFSFFLSVPSNAQTTWINPGSASWTDGVNWSTGIVPDSTTDVLINNGNLAEAVIPGALGLGNQFTHDITINGGAGLTLLPSAFGGLITTGVANVINADVYLEAAWTIQSSLLVGATSLGVTGVVTAQNTTLTSLDATIGGGGTVLKPNTGIVNIQGAVWNNANAIDIATGPDSVGQLNISAIGGQVNNFSSSVGIGAGAVGNINVQSGGVWTLQDRLVLGKESGGTGNLIVTGNQSEVIVGTDLLVGDRGTGTLEISDNGKVTIAAGNGVLSLGGSGTGTLKIGAGAAAGVLAASQINGSGNALVEVNHNEAAYTLAPQLTGNLSAEFKGAGTTIITGNNTYTGNTTVTAGKIIVNNTTGSGTGSGVVTIGQSATLAGNGHIAGDVIVNGVIRPGDIADSLTIGQNLTLASGSITYLDLKGIGASEHDELIVGGNLTVGGTLRIRFLTGYTPGLGDAFDLLDWGGTLSGTFASFDMPTLSNGWTFDTSALYTTGTLTVVPEPSTWMLMVFACLGLGFFALRRRHG